jgi:hypothetical protein
MYVKCTYVKMYVKMYVYMFVTYVCKNVYL